MTENLRIISTIQEALEQRRLVDGCFLCSPNLPGDESWCIYSEVPASTANAFQMGAARSVITSDAMGIGDRNYWLIAQQVHDVQHRFLLPLAFESVGALIVATEGAGLRLVMDGGPSKRLLQAQLQVTDDLREMLLIKLDRDPDVKELMRDLVFSVEGLLRPGALKPAEGERQPTTVSVTVVLPTEILAMGGGLFHQGLSGLKERQELFV